MSRTTLSVVIVLVTSLQNSRAAPPRVLDDRLELAVVAEEPQIVTPVGIACDERGRLFVVESQTHFRPNGYEGPEKDRVRLFEDKDQDGKFERVTDFAEGFTHAMGICLDGTTRAYVITRNNLYLLIDTNDDGRADEQSLLVRLDTPGNYPHNGLSGVTLDPLGNVYFALGENLGVEYKLIGKDGKTLSGGGEGGNIYRCRPDGTELAHVATGFWNTFGLGFDAFGNLFAVDNDPDSRPPCRLLHVVPGGDYGYRFRNGRKGVHPFTAWNGELPGTLPMVCGTGEAPSAVLAYESSGLPIDYQGKLFVTSWGDYRLDMVEVQPRGASFGGVLKTVVQGDDDFRPVCLATGPDGSVYFTDWVLKNYQLHGRGRIWRLRAKERPKAKDLLPSELAQIVGVDVETLNSHLLSRNIESRRAAARRLVAMNVGPRVKRVDEKAREFNLAMLEVLWASARADGIVADPSADIRSQLNFWNSLGWELFHEIVHYAPDQEVQALARHFNDFQHPHIRAAILDRLGPGHLSLAQKVLIDHADDAFLTSAAVHLIARTVDAAEVRKLANHEDARIRLATLLVRRRQAAEPPIDEIRAYLQDIDPQIRRTALQWVGEDQLKPLAKEVEIALKQGVTPDLFQAYLATRERLSGVVRTGKNELGGHQYALPVFLDPNAEPLLRTWALRSVPAGDPGLKTNALLPLLQNSNLALAREAVWTLRDSPRKEALEPLTKLLHDPQASGELRADVVDALAALSAIAPAARTALEQNADKSLAAHTHRVLRPAPAAGAAQQALSSERLAQLKAAFQEPGDPDNGRRVFFMRNGIGCYRCHQVQGRGGKVGPDLTLVVGQLTEQRLLDSLVDPSKEVAPQFVTWLVTTADGRQLTGVMSYRDARGNLTLVDQQGKPHPLKADEIDEMEPAKKSLMPDGLLNQIPLQEYRDLVAFLKTLK